MKIGEIVICNFCGMSNRGKSRILHSPRTDSSICFECIEEMADKVAEVTEGEDAQ